MKDDFTAIYAKHAWGKDKGSGTGSSPRYCAAYLAWLRTVVDGNPGMRVLDLGCGDWQLYQGFDWSSVDYRGVDIVGGVVQANTLVYGDRFERADFNNPDTLWGLLRRHRPQLVLVKDVLQHWSDDELHVWLRAMCASNHWNTLVTVNNWRHFRTPAKDALPRDINNPYRWAPVDMVKRYGFNEVMYYPSGKFKQVARISTRDRLKVVKILEAL